jgi:hypothetical protein
MKHSVSRNAASVVTFGLLLVFSDQLSKAQREPPLRGFGASAIDISQFVLDKSCHRPRLQCRLSRAGP